MRLIIAPLEWYSINCEHVKLLRENLWKYFRRQVELILRTQRSKLNYRGKLKFT